jgi:hypothetical protein
MPAPSVSRHVLEPACVPGRIELWKSAFSRWIQVFRDASGDFTHIQDDHQCRMAIRYLLSGLL